MKNISTFKIFSAGVLLCMVIRVAQKLYAIDPLTGFTNPGSYSTILLIGALLLTLALIGRSIYAINKDQAISALHRSHLMGFQCILLGVSMGVDTYIRASAAAPLYPLIVIPQPVRYLELATASLASIALVALGFLFAGKKSTMQKFSPVCFLIVALWQPILAIIQFAQLRQVTTVSDNLLQCIYWMLLIVFWVTALHTASGIKKPNLACKILFLGYATSLIATVLSVGQIVAIFYFEGAVSGVPLSSAIITLQMAFFCMNFVFHLYMHNEK